MDQARAAVPYFIDILQNYPDVVSYSVKIRIEDEFGREYFWLENTQWQNGGFVGTIGNDPEHTRCVSYGQTVSVSPNDVYDWYYMWDGKMRGNYTLRASLPLMDPDMAAKWSFYTIQRQSVQPDGTRKSRSKHLRSCAHSMRDPGKGRNGATKKSQH